MPQVMLSPTTQRLSCFPYTPRGKPPLPENNMVEKENINKVNKVPEMEVSVKKTDCDDTVILERVERPKLKVIIKEFAKEDNSKNVGSQDTKQSDVKLSQSIDIEEMVTEELRNNNNMTEQEEPSEEEEIDDVEIEEPVSPPPSEQNDIILVEDEDEKFTPSEEITNNSGGSSQGPGTAVAALIRKLLANTADPVVRWEDQAKGEFKVLSPSLLARRIQQANPGQPISGLRCDKGVFESVVGKSLVFRFGGSPCVSPPAPDFQRPGTRRSPPPLHSNKRKTYAQKISELQKPIPGQSSIGGGMTLDRTSPRPMVIQAVPQEAIVSAITLTPRGPGMPALIPLTVDDVGSRRESSAVSKGLHLSGGRVSSVSPPTLRPFSPPTLLTQRDTPQLEPFLLPTHVQEAATQATQEPEPVAELPLDLSGGVKRRADTPELQEQESKKARIQEAKRDDKRKLQQAEACKRYRAAKKYGRKGSSEEEVEELWTFCRAVLHNPNYNPRVICWENIEDGEFRIINQEEFLNCWLMVKGTRLLKEELKRRVKGCEEVELLYSRPHTRLGYRFGARAMDWCPMQGDLVEQGRRMVPSTLTWPHSPFYQQFLKVVKEEPTHSTPLFTLTPLEPLDLPKPIMKMELNEAEKEVKEAEKEPEQMTECEEFACRLVLPRHRGYHAKLVLGDGLSIPLAREVFHHIEEAIKEAARKGARSRLTAGDRNIAGAIIRKAKKKPKVRTGTKGPLPEGVAKEEDKLVGHQSMPLLGVVQDEGEEEEEFQDPEVMFTDKVDIVEQVQEKVLEQEQTQEQDQDLYQEKKQKQEREQEQGQEEKMEESWSPRAQEARHKLPLVVERQSLARAATSPKPLRAFLPTSHQPLTSSSL